MNLVILIGVMTSAPKKTDFPAGGSVTRFRLKTVQPYTIDGELKERSQTHLIDVYNPYLQKEIMPFLREGQMLEVQGALESRNTAKQGEPPRWTTSVVLRGSGILSIFGGPGSNTSVRAEARDQDAEPRVDHRPRDAAPPPALDDGLDDDVPF